MYQMRGNMLDIAHVSPRQKRVSLLLGCGCATASCNQRDDYPAMDA